MDKPAKKCLVCGADFYKPLFQGKQVCSTCASAFQRWSQDPDVRDGECKYSSNCPISASSRTDCRPCTYKKCLAVGLKVEKECPVCLARTTMTYKGKPICDPCRAFFRKYAQGELPKCLTDEHNCEINTATRKLCCKNCRFQKCIKVGFRVGEVPKKESSVCKVCGEVAEGKHFGNSVCEACNSFFRKCVSQKFVLNECKTGPCLITKGTRKACPYCRFKKCKEAGLNENDVGGKVLVEQTSEQIERLLIKKIQNKAIKEGCLPCGVCDGETTLTLQGKPLCKGCERFFRTWANREIPEDCYQESNCTISRDSGSACRPCRFKKCLEIRLDPKRVAKCVCLVCGEDTHRLFDKKPACSSCQVFFVEYVTGNSKVECRNESTCQIRTSNRTSCSHCRFNKCLNVGMTENTAKEMMANLRKCEECGGVLWRQSLSRHKAMHAKLRSKHIAKPENERLDIEEQSRMIVTKVPKNITLQKWGSIGATLAHPLLHARPETLPKYLLKVHQVGAASMHGGNIYCDRGINLEARAVEYTRRALNIQETKIHYPCGFILDSTTSIFGCTPDVLQDDHTIWEIKCFIRPAFYQTTRLVPAEEGRGGNIIFSNLPDTYPKLVEKKMINRNDKIFTQVKHQLMVTGRKVNLIVLFYHDDQTGKYEIWAEYIYADLEKKLIDQHRKDLTDLYIKRVARPMTPLEEYLRQIETQPIFQPRHRTYIANTEFKWPLITPVDLCPKQKGPQKVSVTSTSEAMEEDKAAPKEKSEGGKQVEEKMTQSDQPANFSDVQAAENYDDEEVLSFPDHEDDFFRNYKYEEANKDSEDEDDLEFD